MSLPFGVAWLAADHVASVRFQSDARRGSLDLLILDGIA
jgi:hypothetical protein